MSGLVSFDRAGVLGPTLTLIFNANRYSEQGLCELTKLVKENFMKVAKTKPKGRKEFCANVLKHAKAQTPMLPLEVVHNTFFASMKYEGPPLPYHGDVSREMVPKILKLAQEHICDANLAEQNKEEVSEWLALVLESYMTEEQVASYIKSIASGGDQEALADKRSAIAHKLYDNTLKKELSEKDLDIMLKTISQAMDLLYESKSSLAAQELTGEYLTLFSMSKDPKGLSEDVLGKIDTIFREKMFPKPDNHSVAAPSVTPVENGN